MINVISDSWGRFTQTEMQQGRDEGLLIISSYRVSQKKGAAADPNTS